MQDLQSSPLAPSAKPLRGISSMATKQVLIGLCAMYAEQTGVRVDVESVGGLDAAKRIKNMAQSGEFFDLVLLASDAIDRLIDSGHVRAGSRVDWVNSPVAVAVSAGAASVDISSEAAVKAAVLACPSISYSTGPSGDYLNRLFERWGITSEVKAKLITPPPGVAVGSLIASDQVALGFQQLSELLFVDGIHVLGNLPTELAFITTFSSAAPTSVPSDSPQALAARAFQTFLASRATAPMKLAQGMHWPNANAHAQP
jgi:molybdate transport system substrate-binding protein